MVPLILCLGPHFTHKIIVAANHFFFLNKLKATIFMWLIKFASLDPKIKFLVVHEVPK